MTRAVVYGEHRAAWHAMLWGARGALRSAQGSAGCAVSYGARCPHGLRCSMTSTATVASATSVFMTMVAILCSLWLFICLILLMLCSLSLHGFSMGLPATFLLLHRFITHVLLAWG